MAREPTREFGKRRPVELRPVEQVPVKRSGHVALLLMGTFAVGGSAYALMPRGNCEPTPSGMAAPVDCQERGTSSSGGHGGSYSSRSSFFSGGSSASPSASGISATNTGGVERGGFGSFAHAFAGHFSGG